MASHHRSTLASPDSLAKNARLTQARKLLGGRQHASRAGQGTTVSRKATADARFIAASLNYRRCAKAHIAATGAWASFSASHPHDDPAHEEHHRRVIATRQALNGADVALSVAEHELLGTNGEGAR